MSFFQEKGLSVKVTRPLWTSVGEQEWNLSATINTWDHEIAVDGGYRSARFQIAANDRMIEDWLESGLGRHVECYNQAGIKIWEGFINSISASLGTLSITRGPLLSVANRVGVTYTPIVDTEVEPMTTGAATMTTLSEDTDSQDKWAIQEEIISGGTLMDDATWCGSACTPDNEAEEIRDAYLGEHKYPETSESINVGGPAQPQLTLECAGYVEFLNRYIVDDDTEGTTTIPAKIQTVLGLDVNSIFSTDYNYINDAAAFLLLTPSLEIENRKAKTIIDEMVAQGDGNDNRTYFMILNDLKAYYDAIPTTIDYHHRIAAKDSVVTTPTGARIDPWDVRPAKWAFLPDFMVGRTFPSELRLDPRNVFIESVRFTAPNGLVLEGGKVSNVKQLMAKKGGG
jgi:hypothetical protein